jgi:hypothetical protein
MKLFLAILTVLMLQQASAFVAPNADTTLKAVKGNRISKYKIGKYLKINILKELTIKGRLIAATKDSIKLRPLTKTFPIQSIAIKDITAIKKLHKKGRRGWIPLVLIILLLTIAGLIYNNAGLVTGLLLLVPVVFLFTGFPFLLGNFLADLLSKKSTKMGWRFYSE